MTIKIILALSAGLIGGIAFTLIYLSMSAQSLMFKEDVAKADFETTVSALEEGVAAKGWKIPAIHDLKETMRKNNKPDVLNAKVFEICQPDHAHQILSRDKERVAVSMMPCRIAVYEKTDGSVIISRMNASLMGRLMTGIIPEVMKSASEESEEIISKLIK